jgi:hypothetical protein
MFMRFLGGGVGHKATRDKVGAPDFDHPYETLEEEEVPIPVNGQEDTDDEESVGGEDDIGDDDGDLGAEDGEDGNYVIPEDQGYGAL